MRVRSVPTRASTRPNNNNTHNNTQNNKPASSCLSKPNQRRLFGVTGRYNSSSLGAWNHGSMSNSIVVSKRMAHAAAYKPPKDPARVPDKAKAIMPQYVKEMARQQDGAWHFQHPVGNAPLRYALKKRTSLTPAEEAELRDLRTNDPFGWGQRDLQKKFNIPGALVGKIQPMPYSKLKSIRSESQPKKRDVVARERWKVQNAQLAEVNRAEENAIQERIQRKLGARKSAKRANQAVKNAEITKLKDEDE